MKIYTRKSAPKYRNENQKKNAQLIFWKFYKVLKPHVQLVLGNEKYFSLNGDISCNRQYYTTDSFTTPLEGKYKTKMKFEPKLLAWMGISQKGVSSIYVYRSGIPIKQEGWTISTKIAKLFHFQKKSFTPHKVKQKAFFHSI